MMETVASVNGEAYKIKQGISDTGPTGKATGEPSVIQTANRIQVTADSWNMR